MFASFDNVFHNFNDMMFFIKYCSKMDIRIISLSDELDTHDKLFPERRTADTLNLTQVSDLDFEVEFIV